MIICLLVYLPACKKNILFADDASLPSFIISEEIADTVCVTDTVLTYNYARFTPGKKYDSVQWRINNNEYSRMPLLVMKFITAGDFLINMIGFRHATSAELIKDSVTKRLHVVSREGGATYLGNFRGFVLGAEKDSFTINIFRAVVNYNSYPENTHILSNLPKGCTSQLPPDGIAPLTTLYFGYKMFVTRAARCFPGSQCIGSLQNGKLIIDFAVRDTSKPFDPGTGNYPLLPKKFKGYRL